MRGFFRRTEGPLRRVLVIESGPREAAELTLARFAALPYCDVLTCYKTAPEAFDAARGTLFSVHQPDALANRRAFAKKLAHGPYDAIAILCPGSGVLAKWKWMIAAETRARLIIADEYGEWFFVSFHNLPQLAVLLIRRSNLASLPLLLLAVAKLILAPFVIGYLLLYTLVVHLRRMLRLAVRRRSTKLAAS
jgi:hypothetical protein